MGAIIIPSFVTMIPGDIQRFTVSGPPPPSAYAAVNNAVISVDGSLTIINGTAGNTAQGTLIHTLRSGIGSAELVIDAKSLVTNSGGTGEIILSFTDSAQALNFELFIRATTIELALASMSGNPGSTGHTLAIGDVFTFNFNGNRWSIDLNGTEVFHASPNSAITYPILPISPGIAITTPVSATPAHILPLILTGDWQIPRGTWTATGGTLIPASGTIVYVDYLADGTPGEYTVTVDPGSPFIASGIAYIYIPPLMIIGPRVIEVDPGAIVYFKANYDQAKNSAAVATWTAVTAGGTFSASVAGKYTASSSPGNYIVRAGAAWNSLSQKDEVTVRVRTTLTPVSEPVYPSEARTNTSNMSGTQNWTGTVSLSGSGSSRTWTAPSTVGTIAMITVDNGTISRSQQYEVIDALPVGYAIQPRPGRSGPIIIDDYADDGRTYWSRSKSASDFNPEAWTLTMVLTTTEWTTLRDFHATARRNGQRFFITDYFLNVRVVVRFAGDLETEAEGDCLVRVSVGVRKA